MADEETWSRVGRELLSRDPGRFLALLKVADDICAIHRAPLGDPIPGGYYVFPKHESDDFD